jgi:hypothetical protein
MIDITNKSVEQLNALKQKYAKILESIPDNEKNYHAYVIDVAINFINTYYPIINNNWKSWIVVVVVKLREIINNENDIGNIINKFLIFHNINYDKYIDEIICLDEVDRDLDFINDFIKKEKTVA